MSQEQADEERIERNQEYINDPQVRQELFKQFAPTFCYHKEEGSFPLHPDDFVKNVIEAKHDEYTNIQNRQGRGLTDIEQKELDVIEKYFWNNEGFNPDYKKHENKEGFQEVVNPRKSKFLVFDEKKYGYKVGEKIDIVGVAPIGHPKHNPTKPSAPISASIIPTKEGFFIQYQSVYSLNNAIKGTRWLRDSLPNWIADKADNFGLHYGDCEGVGIYVNVDDNGTASMKSLQTFAHGRDGAREVAAQDCTFDKEKTCVYVGLGGHPSYADNFVGRNKFADVVGDAYKITPTEFLDISPSQKDRTQIPPSLNSFKRLADSDPLLSSQTAYATTAKELEDRSKEWHRYNPVLFITKAWNKIKSSVKSFFGYKEEKQQAPEPFDVKTCAERHTNSIEHEAEKEKGVEKTPSPDSSKAPTTPNKSWQQDVGKKEERRVTVAAGTKRMG